jgi:hypothetical protein
VAFEVVNAEKWLLVQESQCFSRCQTNEQGTNQTGSTGSGNAVDRWPINLGLLEGFIDGQVNSFKVLARGDFGHNAAVALMGRDLRGHYTAENLSVLHDRHGGFITACFDC